MKTFDVGDLKREVRITLDQNSTGGQLVTIDDIDALMLESIIESKLVDAARIVESEAPVHLLDSGVTCEETNITWSENIEGSGSIELPEDFLRLVVFKMNDWMRPIVSVVPISDPLYSLQKSRFAGLRGCPERPIVAIVPSTDSQLLEFYSCLDKEEASVELFQYIPMPSVSEHGKISLCEKLKSAIVYYTAYLVALSVGEAELAATLKSTAELLMQ